MFRGTISLNIMELQATCLVCFDLFANFACNRTTIKTKHYDMRKAKLYINNACRTFLITLAACALPLAFSACSDDSGDDGGNGPGTGEVDNEVGDFDTPAFADYAAKYEITDEGSDYKSIELTESGFYIITTKNGQAQTTKTGTETATNKSATQHPTMLTPYCSRASSGEMNPGDVIYGHISGSYTVTGENTFHLENIGTLKVIHEGNAIYSLNVVSEDGQRSILLKSSLYEPLYRNSAKTLSLCRTWDIVKLRYWYIINGKTIANIEGNTYEELVYNIDQWAKENDPDYDGDGPIVDLTGRSPRRIMFSKFGTYAVFYKEGTMAVSTWAWADIARGILVYSWDNIYDGDTDGNVVIRFRGNNAYMIEAYGENDGFTSYEEGTEITLQEVK